MSTVIAPVKPLSPKDNLREENRQLRDCILLLKKQLLQEVEANKALHSKFRTLQEKVRQFERNQKATVVKSVPNQSPISTQNSNTEVKEQIYLVKREASVQLPSKQSKPSISLRTMVNNFSEDIQAKISKDLNNAKTSQNTLKNTLLRRNSLRSQCNSQRSEESAEKSFRTFKDAKETRVQEDFFSEKIPLKLLPSQAHERRLNYYEKIDRRRLK